MPRRVSATLGRCILRRVYLPQETDSRWAGRRDAAVIGLFSESRYTAWRLLSQVAVIGSTYAVSEKQVWKTAASWSGRDHTSRLAHE